MHRQPLLEMIERYAEAHPGERDTADRVHDFVSRYSDCFERSLKVGHITGSAWIIDRTGTKTLLTHHRKLGIWLQPGGHADGNSNVLEVAMQECLEETGLTSIEPVSVEIFDMDVHGIPARKDEPSHFHYDVRFLIQQKGDEDYVISPESHDLAWVSMEELESYTIEWSMRRMRNKALSRLEDRKES
ncbi:MAG: NUDIX hydrolase [Verrucomicrobiales bacterium]|nr:NUDIX hydrolase [Verrucomicrobiales bacterium]